MGEAKIKANRSRQWRDSLSDEEKTIAEVAQRLFDRIVAPSQATGMCYRLTLFLAEFLGDEHGLIVQPIVGYINDGSGELMASHAWIETCGKRTDLSLGFTEYPEVQLPGEVLILDRVVQAGVSYTYSRNQSPEGIEAFEKLRSNPRGRFIVEHKDKEHNAMVERSKNPLLRRPYLDLAPDEFDYSRLVNIIKGNK